MAGIAYFIKAEEDDLNVGYRYGQSPEHLESVLAVDKRSLLPAGDAADLRGLTARTAVTTIVTTFQARGSWPERGSGFG